MLNFENFEIKCNLPELSIELLKFLHYTKNFVQTIFFSRCIFDIIKVLGGAKFKFWNGELNSP